MIEYKNVIWYPYHGSLMPRVPPHINITLSKKEQVNLLLISGAYFLRYTNSWDSKQSEFWYIVKDYFGGMDELSSNTRNQIRKAQKFFTVKKVNMKEISDHGYDVYISAFRSYKTHLSPISREEFSANILKSVQYDFFAVYTQDTEEMVAYSSNTIEDKVCSYTTVKSNPKYLKQYSNYILFYEMNKFYLEEQKFDYVHDGARSISHDTNIHNYLLQKFKFKKVYVCLNVTYSDRLNLFVQLLYPFRLLIGKIKSRSFSKLNTLLVQEQIRRSFE